MALHNWMSNLKDDRRLNQIVLPATHDSGMSAQSYAGAVQNALNPLAIVAKIGTATFATLDDLRPRFLGGSARASMHLLHDNFTTQAVNVAGQLNFGARQFDLRITRHNGTHRAYHGHVAGKIAGLRRYGEKWADICAAIAAFMAANPTEVLILKMDKQETGATGLAAATGYGWTKSTMKILVDALQKAGCTEKKPDMLWRWVDNATIGELRGRILVCGPEDTLAQWKPMVASVPIQLCLWKKDERGVHPNGAEAPAARISPNIPAYPTYLLLGGAKAKGDKEHASRDNVLDKQEGMKKAFSAIDRTGKAGMRGIWFNTFSWIRDIKTYSTEIWDSGNRLRREALWLDGPARQNVASVDFLDESIGEYVISKNPETNWKGKLGFDFDRLDLTYSPQKQLNRQEDKDAKSRLNSLAVMASWRLFSSSLHAP